EGPYEHDLVVGHWLNGLGNGCISGLAARNRPTGPVAEIGAKELLEVANNGRTPELRSLAIRALGRDPHAYQAAIVAQWLRDPSIEVRRAAVLVSADLPDRQPIMAASRDVSPQIRRSAAYAVGFAQDPGLLRLLGELLQDPVPDVRNAA